MEEEIIKPEDIRTFWHTAKHLDIFLAVIAGKQPKQIEQELGLQAFTLMNIVRNPIFKKQMTEYLAMTLDNFTAEQVADFPDIYRKVKAIVYQKLNDVSPDTIFREFMKLIPREERKDLIIEAIKIKKKISKGEAEGGEVSEERAVELKRIFGYDPQTKPTIENPRLDKPKEAEDQ